MKLDTRGMKFNIKEGHAVAFDFDGVIHRYSKGWQDGSIYDTYNREILDLILILNTMKVPVFILSTREPKQIKEWWDKQGFSMKVEIIESGTLFFNDLEYVGITRTKLPAQIYVDDRAYHYTGQTVKEFLLDFVWNRRVEEMREILFRAKRRDNGEWVEGYYVYDYSHDAHYIFANIIATPNCVHDRRESFSLGYYEIDPDTLCQYTGLTDKNAKKIWENDILRGHGNNNDLARAVFGKFNVIDVETLEVVDKVIGWHTNVIETDALSKCKPFCLPMPLTDFYIKRSEYEVVGNIFDNAELLEVE